MDMQAHADNWEVLKSCRDYDVFQPPSEERQRQPNVSSHGGQSGQQGCIAKPRVEEEEAGGGPCVDLVDLILFWRGVLSGLIRLGCKFYLRGWALGLVWNFGRLGRKRLGCRNFKILSASSSSLQRCNAKATTQTKGRSSSSLRPVPQAGERKLADLLVKRL
ncbi:hypothetical protein G7Y89_g6604 [Cudoniella acicularis]|uniref:Uncharacterized protein n=1 Tax=Cudoniella acicularis TaxID=354080 RepID=A0A8H4RKY9_9HELO|nr:hypothetical protein G7Y89_g6604 [Cudoniella acicularis]